MPESLIREFCNFRDRDPRADSTRAGGGGGAGGEGLDNVRARFNNVVVLYVVMRVTFSA